MMTPLWLYGLTVRIGHNLPQKCAGMENVVKAISRDNGLHRIIEMDEV
jgi:hypothetical protein